MSALKIYQWVVWRTRLYLSNRSFFSISLIAQVSITFILSKIAENNDNKLKKIKQTKKKITTNTLTRRNVTGHLITRVFTKLYQNFWFVLNLRHWNKGHPTWKKCQSVHHLPDRQISLNSVECRVVGAVLTSQASIYRF